MKCFITGATGFIGKKLCRYLLGEGHDVLALVRKMSNLDELQKIYVETCAPATHAETVASLAGFAPDVVLHLASLFIARHKTEDIVPLIESNIAYPTKILEAMKDAGVRNFVNIGTAWQNSIGDDYSPSCLYAATKQAFVDILKFYGDVHDIKHTTLKFFDTYGSGDTRPKVLNLLKKIAYSGEILKMSPGEQKLDIVHVHDVVRAVLKAGQLLASGVPHLDEYVVSTKKLHSLKDIAAIAERVSGKKLNIEWGGLPYREGEIMTPWTGGEWLPGWSPAISLEEGLREVFCG